MPIGRISCGQAEIRAHRIFEWLMKTEPPVGKGGNPRWHAFERLRDRLRPHRLPLQIRVELALTGMAGAKMSPLLEHNIKINWNGK